LRVIVALGNPGDRYRDSRHNVGWWLADRIARTWGCRPFLADGLTARTSCVRATPVEQNVELHKPLTFMNRSGEAVRALLESRGFEAASEMLVLVDDVSLPPGQIRLRARGSAGGHNGLTSIVQTLEADRFCRLRIGVGRPGDRRVDLAAWVLAGMSRGDEEIALASFARAVQAVESWIDHGIDETMSRFN